MFIPILMVNTVTWSLSVQKCLGEKLD